MVLEEGRNEKPLSAVIRISAREPLFTMRVFLRDLRKSNSPQKWVLQSLTFHK